MRREASVALTITRCPTSCRCDRHLGALNTAAAGGMPLEGIAIDFGVLPLLGKWSRLAEALPQMADYQLGAVTHNLLKKLDRMGWRHILCMSLFIAWQERLPGESSDE